MVWFGLRPCGLVTVGGRPNGEGLTFPAEATEAKRTGAKTSVVVVSTVRLYREGIRLLLDGDARLEVLGTAATHADAVALVELAPDVVLLDTSIANAGAALSALGAPAQKVVVLGVTEDEEHVIAWAEAGAAGYVSRDGSSDDLRATIEAAANGETLCSPRMVAALLRRLNAVARDAAGHDVTELLTPREREVAKLVGEGLSNKEIAGRLCIELPTVKNHVHNVLRKLDISRRGQAAAFLRTE
jgi:two-component system, NarL family, nitrate/nitrite response regulator NarL